MRQADSWPVTVALKTEFMLHLYELQCSLRLNPVFPLCYQVYKATGEEFLKIAGGQISDSFLLVFYLLSMFCMRTCSERFSVRVKRTFISRLSRIFEEKQDPATSVRKQLFTDHKRRALICALALSPITCVFASSQWLSSSLSWTNERRFVRSFPHFPSSPPQHPPPLPPSGQLERNFTLG